MVRRVPVDGDPVGMMLDVSDTGGQTMAAYAASQPELVSNGWTLSTGWSVSADGTALTQDGTGSGTSHAVKLDNVPAGTVEVSFDVSASTGCDLLDSAGVVSSNLSAGSYTFTISNAAQNANNLRFRPSGEAVVISNISVKKISSHAAIAPSDLSLIHISEPTRPY